jgi:plasmid stabilization system protein ParE
MGEGRYKVELSHQALRDLEEIVSFIAADNPPAAERFGLRLIDEAEAIAPHPLAGRMVPEFGDPVIRERIFRAYRIVYRVHEEKHLLVVSRFWHTARGTPEIYEPDDLPPPVT